MGTGVFSALVSITSFARETLEKKTQNARNVIDKTIAKDELAGRCVLSLTKIPSPSLFVSWVSEIQFSQNPPIVNRRQSLLYEIFLKPKSLTKICVFVKLLVRTDKIIAGSNGRTDKTTGSYSKEQSTLRGKINKLEPMNSDKSHDEV